MKNVKQIKRLPNGVTLVKQDWYNGQKECGGKYAAFTKSGRMITATAGNNKRTARKNVLEELNRQLKMICLTWGLFLEKKQVNELLY